MRDRTKDSFCAALMAVCLFQLEESLNFPRYGAALLAAAGGVVLMLGLERFQLWRNARRSARV